MLESVRVTPSSPSAGGRGVNRRLPVDVTRDGALEAHPRERLGRLATDDLPGRLVELLAKRRLDAAVVALDVVEEDEGVDAVAPPEAVGPEQHTVRMNGAARPDPPRASPRSAPG